MSKQKETKLGPIFAKEDLIKNANILGEPVEIVTAALLEVSEPISVEQAKELIEDFKTRPVTNK
jgi:hypothetical protein